MKNPKKVREKQQDQSQNDSLLNMFPAGSGITERLQSSTTAPVEQDQSRHGQFSRSTAVPNGGGGSKGRRLETQNVQLSKPKNRMLDIFPNAAIGSAGNDKIGGESQGATHDSEDPVLAEYVQKVSKELFSPIWSTRTPTTTVTTRISEQFQLGWILNNRQQLPERTTTIDPRYLMGLPANEVPRQKRHRRNVRQRPRGRRKHT